MQLIAEQEIAERLERILGRGVVSQLEFREHVADMEGRELYGFMENGRIVLESIRGKVLQGVEMHEAMHYILDNLLGKEAHARVERAARELVAQRDGIRPEEVTDTQWNEFVAVEAERARYDTSTFFGRVMKWIHNIFRRWGEERAVIRDLIYEAEGGAFRNVEPDMVRSDMRRSIKDTGEELAWIEGFNNKDRISRQRLMRVFPDRRYLRRIIDYTAKNLFEQSRFGILDRDALREGRASEKDFFDVSEEIQRQLRERVAEKFAKDKYYEEKFNELLSRDPEDLYENASDQEYADYTDFMLSSPTVHRDILNQIFGSKVVDREYRDAALARESERARVNVIKAPSQSPDGNEVSLGLSEPRTPEQIARDARGNALFENDETIFWENRLGPSAPCS